jgi:hypothetical protein
MIWQLWLENMEGTKKGYNFQLIFRRMYSYIREHQINAFCDHIKPYYAARKHAVFHYNQLSPFANM